MKLAAIVVLLALPSLAAADAPCKPTGAVTFEIDHSGATTGPRSSTLKIFANGAWTYESTDANGGAGPKGGACLDEATGKQVADLVKVPWKTENVMHCMARTAERTDFLVNGKKVFTEIMCNSVKLDDASAKALEQLKAIAAPLVPKA